MSVRRIRRIAGAASQARRAAPQIGRHPREGEDPVTLFSAAVDSAEANAPSPRLTSHPAVENRANDDATTSPSAKKTSSSTKKTSISAKKTSTSVKKASSSFQKHRHPREGGDPVTLFSAAVESAEANAPSPRLTSHPAVRSRANDAVMHARRAAP
jgi:hypothetical protein